MPDRVTLRRTKGWKLPPNTVVVARPTIWGNPFKLENAIEAGYRDPQTAVVDAFRSWLNGNPWACGSDHYTAKRSTILARLPELRGKNLACWCKPGQPCHADVLLELANSEIKT